MEKGSDFLLLQVPNHNQEPYHLSLAAIDLYLQSQQINSDAWDLLFVHGEYFPNEFKSSFWEDLNSPEISEIDRDQHKALQELIIHLVAKIRTVNPTLLGFSLIGENYFLSLYLAKKIKASCPGIKIIFGGCGERWAPIEESHFSYFDFLVAGSGELPIVNILNHLKNDQELENTDGISYKKNGQILMNTKQAAILKSTELPLITMQQFTQHPIYLELFGNEVSIMFHKGCPFRCSFCSAHLYFNKFTKNTVEKCVDYVANFHNDPRSIYISDATINADDEWLKSWAGQVIDRKIKINWRGWYRLSPSLNDSAYLELLVDSGCISFDFGLETASPTMLTHMKKFSDTKVIYEIFEKIRQLSKERQHTIKVKLNILVGYPTETDEDFKTTMKFIAFNSDIISKVSFNAFGMPHNLPLYDRIMKDGLLFKNSTNWCSEFSTPDIRRKRMQIFKDLLQRLGISHLFYLWNDLNNIPPGEELTSYDWQQSFNRASS